MTTRILAKYHRTTNDAETLAKIQHAIRENKPIPIEPGSPAGKRALRGIPCVGGVAGTIPGTNPLAALLEKEGKR